LGSARTWSLRNGFGFIAVLVTHVAIVSVVILTSRIRYSQLPARDFVSTWIPLSTAPAPKFSTPKPLSRTPSFTIDPIQIEPPKIESLPSPAVETGRAVDWTMEAQRAVTAQSSAPKTRELGAHPRADSHREQQYPPAAHQAGEEYRDAYGDTVVWLNDRCYVVSESPALGAPDVLARSQPTHTVCVDPSAPEGELFKSLPAYKRYHPQQ
jgi:hypothetical protein